jgi:hypothetical protein
MAMKTEIEALREEIAKLRERVAVLEARPAAQPQPLWTYQPPSQAPQWVSPYPGYPCPVTC